MVWGKWCEEKHREGKEMKRPIYLEMRLWEGAWLEGQIRASLRRTWNGILQRMTMLYISGYRKMFILYLKKKIHFTNI